MKEASPIYVTSLTGNHSGTTTLTTSNLSSSNFTNQQTSAAPTIVTTSNVNQSRIQSIVHVHQPPPSITKQTNQPLAGGWLIGESAKGRLITTNEQQVFQNILNNNTNPNTNINSNNLSSNSAGGTVVFSGNCISSTSESIVNVSNLTSAANSCNLNAKYYGSLATTSTGNTGELANGHGPRKEVCFH